MNNTQQLKPDPKGKAIASLVLGIVNVIVVLLVTLLAIDTLFGTGGIEGAMGLFYVVVPGWILSVIVGSVGLILGKGGLKSSKKNFAIKGIVLCKITILIPILSFVIVLIIFLWKFFTNQPLPPPSPPS